MTKLPVYVAAFDAGNAYWAAYDVWKIARLEWEAESSEATSKALTVAEQALAVAEKAYQAATRRVNDVA